MIIRTQTVMKVLINWNLKRAHSFLCSLNASLRRINEWILSNLTRIRSWTKGSFGGITQLFRSIGVFKLIVSSSVWPAHISFWMVPNELYIPIIRAMHFWVTILPRWFTLERMRIKASPSVFLCVVGRRGCWEQVYLRWVSKDPQV